MLPSLYRQTVLEDFGGLQRVIAVGQAVELDAGGTLIVTAIEIWEHGLILHSAEQLPEFLPPGTPITNTSYWEITDDLGTPYVPAGGAASGSQSHRIGTHEFSTAPPHGAKFLSIVGPGMRAVQAIVVEFG